MEIVRSSHNSVLSEGFFSDMLCSVTIINVYEAVNSFLRCLMWNCNERVYKFMYFILHVHWNVADNDLIRHSDQPWHWAYVVYILITFRVWVVDDAKCILVTRVCLCLCVCLSLAAFPHYCTDPDVTWRNGRGSPSCALILLGGFAIGARVSLLRQHSANAKCQWVLVLALCLVWLIRHNEDSKDSLI